MNTPRRPLVIRGAIGLLGLVCATQAGIALAQNAIPTSAAVLESEPPALRRLLQQGNELEAQSDKPDNEWQAAILYCQATRGGSAEGQYRLGMLYAFGQGVPQSRPFAAALFSLAASLGHAQASRMLDTIELSSLELPACAHSGELPEKAPAPVVETPPPEQTASSGTSIEQLLLTVPAHKRWIIPLASTMSGWYALDPRLVLSVIAVESNFDTGARSPKSAMGLMQLIPDTAERFNVRDAFDATQNLRGGMRYLRWLLSYYRGNISYALAAYNAGEGRVDRYKGIPPFAETRAYVKRIIDLYGAVRHSFDETLTAASPWLAAGGR